MRRAFSMLALAVLCLVGVAAADTTPVPAPEAPATTSIDAQVQGTCRTPREAMLQLLYWVQQGDRRVEPARAAACFDTSTVGTDVAAERAVQLKNTLDARGLYVDTEAIPADPDFTAADGFHRWRLPDLSAVEIVKLGNRWLFSTATVKAIPELHAQTTPPLLERILASLPDWFHDQLAGIAVWQLCGILLCLLIALTLQKVVVFFIATYVRRAAGRFTKWADTAVARVARPVGGLVMAGVFYLFIPWLHLSVRASEIAGVATTALAGYSVAWLAYRLVDVLADWLIVKADKTESKLDDQLVPLLRTSLKVFIAVIGTIFVLQNMHVDVGSLLAGLGLGGLAFALAAQDTVKNFFGSLVVFIDKPFQIGDWVTIAGIEGLIEEVGFRTTRVRTFYNSLVTIPNAKLTDTPIDNYGARRWRRYSTNVTVRYDTPPERITAFVEGIEATVLRLDGMRKDYVVVAFDGYKEWGLNVMIYCFMDVSDWKTEMAVRTRLNVEILKLATDLGVSFAMPTRTVHMETQAEPAPLPGRPPLDDAQIAAIVRRYGSSGSAESPPT
jgi:MscS family membrane protein